MLVEIGEKIISTEIFEKHFVCDLNKCKGSCCIEGDSGAPLNDEDILQIEKSISKINPYLSAQSKKKIKLDGFFQIDEDNEKVTTLLDDGACVFAVKDEKGIYNCAIEIANENDKIGFKKPLSCHLYPIRLKNFKDYIGVNYDKWSICSPACKLGNSLQIKIYQFLKEPIERAFGKEFFNELKEVDRELNQ